MKNPLSNLQDDTVAYLRSILPPGQKVFVEYIRRTDTGNSLYTVNVIRGDGVQHLGGYLNRIGAGRTNKQNHIWSHDITYTVNRLAVALHGKDATFRVVRV